MQTKDYKLNKRKKVTKPRKKRVALFIKVYVNFCQMVQPNRHTSPLMSSLSGSLFVCY